MSKNIRFEKGKTYYCKALNLKIYTCDIAEILEQKKWARVSVKDSAGNTIYIGCVSVDANHPDTDAEFISIYVSNDLRLYFWSDDVVE